jgi:diguanylate cyclase (GGDEF)-like protein
MIAPPLALPLESREDDWLPSVEMNGHASFGEGMDHACLKQVRHLLVVEDHEGQRLLTLEASSHSIGRDPSNSIVLSSKAVSRQHALLLRVTSSEANSFGFMLIDGDLQGQRSTNGIKVNGKKCLSHRLKHGEHIMFGNHVKARYLILPPLTDPEFANYCQQLDRDALLADSVPHQATLVISGLDPDDLAQDDFDEASLARMASFPEINPSPMFEVNLKGELTYLNPAAVNTFPDLRRSGSEHPTLKGLLALIQSADHHILVREVEVAGQMFEQSIHYISESDLVRCCLFDITERKHAEAELRKRDRLLQSVAEATTHLLGTMGQDAAITTALQILGNAAGVDRICICENHPHPETGVLAMSIRFEWTRDGIASIWAAPHMYNQPYTSPALKRWYHILTDESAIRGLVRDLSAAEQAMLARDQILSVLVVPIIVNDQFWGFIELDNCTLEYQWSPQEESVLFAMAASISAALQRHHREEIIRYQAFHDALTNLPNRVFFNEHLEMALRAAQVNQTQVAVMFMDLDRFKTINDTLGHAIGDDLLKQVAQRLSECLRKGDILARWGGDEFTILLSTITEVEDALEVANRILETLKDPFNIAGHELYVSTSIGISIYPEDGQAPGLLLQNADVALYRSKDQGRGSCQLYNIAMNSKAPELFTLEHHLRHALERDELRVYYQPKVNIQTGAIVGLEALIRWEHPEMGMVSPGTFIPLAEETGLIVDIGEWILRTACEQLVSWHRLGLQPLSIAVNLSARQFFQPNLVDLVAQTLIDAQLDPQFLELEITETTAVKNIEFTRSVLKQLQALNVSIAMDDFGTGYSSLNYLKQLPFNTLKVDQGFIRDLRPNSTDAVIINAVIAMGRGLKLKVVAEGVETQEQLDLLKALQCEVVQGYFFSRPLPVNESTLALQTNWEHRDRMMILPAVA